jgi:hypothetical protein
MDLLDFITALKMELRLRGLPFDRGDVVEFAEDVWPLAEDDPDSGRWADAFLAGRTVEA